MSFADDRGEDAGAERAAVGSTTAAVSAAATGPAPAGNVPDEAQPAWFPPHGWAPAADAASSAPDATGPAPTPGKFTGPLATWLRREGPLTRTPRRRAWLIAASMAALLGIYLCIITYYIAGHMTDRYQQVPPGTTVTAQKTEYTLLELTSVSAPPSGNGGENDKPDKNTAYVIARVRVLTHDPDPSSYLCSLKLVGPGRRAWDNDYTSTLPLSKDSDYCDGLKPEVPVVVTVAFGYPETFAGQLRGVAVDPNNGTPDLVLTPPAP